MGLVVVVNYEAAWQATMAAVLLAQVWDRVILDESHRVKSPSGTASKFVAKLGRHAHRRLALTGTPMPHSPLDVFGQYRFLDPGIFGTSFVQFRSRYAVMGGFGGYEIKGWQHEEELAAKAYSIAYRIADEELDAILGLEEPVHQVVECELSASAKTLYYDLWRDFCADVGGGVVTAANALVRLLRVAQVTSGHLPVVDDEGGVVIEEVDTAKREALKDLLEDLPPDEPVVVFARFTPDLDAVEWVANELGRTYGELSGRRRDALADDATLAPGVTLAGVNMQSGGVGVDFSRAHFCVFYSVGFSLGDYDQALKRTHRPGQEHRVTYYHLVARATVDEYVYEALRERKDVVDFVLGLAS
jgi:SNF2 family DNA or RNA helicase